MFEVIGSIPVRAILPQKEERSKGNYEEKHDYEIDLGTESYFDAGGSTITQPRSAPLFIASPIGISIYNRGTSTNGHTTLFYNWLK